MKPRIHHALISALIGLFVYEIIFQHRLLNETLKATDQLDHQLDSLWQLWNRYESIHQQYETAYINLSLAQLELTQIHTDFAQLSEAQQAYLLRIQDQLRLLTLPERNIRATLPMHSSDSLDSLRFQP